MHERMCTDSASGRRERTRERTEVARPRSLMSALTLHGSRAAKQGARTRGVGVSGQGGAL